MADDIQLTSLTTDIVVSFLEANKMKAEDVGALIRTVHGALSGVDAPPAPETPAAPKLTAAQIRKSVTSERLISFEDGQGYTMLRRHLTARGLTPAEYREKWGLPVNYPMTAPAYSQTRSNLAKTLGLGRNLAAAPSRGRGKKPAS